MAKPVCRLCGKDAFDCSGWLERVTQVPRREWECRPSCNEVPLTCEDRVLGVADREGEGADEPARETQEEREREADPRRV